ncbi:hypothetical protein [Lysinibacillus capsici]|uniref:hypothetical protein n=1 Tax=Lysinibacillus capsici TaxID=2115968 RepID=UPI002FDDE0E5
MKNYELKSPFDQGEICMNKNERQVAAKRVNIVQVKLIREKLMLYKGSKVRSPQDGYEIFKE